MRATPATVIFLSRHKGMIVVQHDEGFTVVELLGDEGLIELGDVLTADWSVDGGRERVKSTNLQRSCEVYLQGTWASRDHAIQVARRTGGG